MNSKNGRNNEWKYWKIVQNRAKDISFCLLLQYESGVQ